MNYKFKIMRNSIAILFLSLLFAGCQSADLEQMDLRPLMEEHAITGIQAVFAQEKPLSKNYNEEYFIYGEGIADTTVFQAASLSKVLFSYVALSLYDEGLFDLDTPLMEYYDNGRFASGQDSIYARMLTARHVLSHRTGLKNWAASPSLTPGPPAPSPSKRNLTRRATAPLCSPTREKGSHIFSTPWSTLPASLSMNSLRNMYSNPSECQIRGTDGETLSRDR